MANAEIKYPDLLAGLLGGITGGGIHVIDLTMTLDQHGPTIVLPRPLAAIAALAMSPAPEGRYASAEALAADVARFQDGEPPLACPEGLLGKAWRLAGRHRVAILLLLTYVVVRGIVLIFLGR